MNYYAVLGVPEDASPETIHNAFRALARQYHPDAGVGSSAGKFREIVEAHEALSDPERRRAYDRMLARERTPAPDNYVPIQNVVVEPLAQPWSRSQARPMFVRFGQLRGPDDWFEADWVEEVFRSFQEFLYTSWLK
jgi:curved DNA-binding protein CbpA